MAAAEEGRCIPPEDAVEVESSFPKLKAFIKDLEDLGRVRIIVNTGLGVIETMATLEGFFYTEFGGKGEYGNIVKAEENVYFHLLLSEVEKVQLSSSKATSGNFLAHSARFYDKKGVNGASVFVMWKPGTNGEYDDGQVEAFQRLQDKYGEEITFS